MAAAWHWQERLEAVDVVGACRRQIFKIRKSKPYSHWLQEKTQITGSKKFGVQEITNDNEEDKQSEIDDAFQKWLCQKRKQSQSAKRRKQEVTTEKKLFQYPPRKPPSLHVNPKTKGTGKTKCAGYLKPHGNRPLHPGHSKVANQQAFETWLARVRREDKARQTLRREEQDRIEHQNREVHKLTWKKNLVFRFTLHDERGLDIALTEKQRETIKSGYLFKSMTME